MSKTPRVDAMEQCIKGPNPWSPYDHTAVASEQARKLETEIGYWRERYEEVSLHVDRLAREVSRIDLMQAEIDDIQIMVGCNHVEGLARCVRERLEELR